MPFVIREEVLDGDPQGSIPGAAVVSLYVANMKISPAQLTLYADDATTKITLRKR